MAYGISVSYVSYPEVKDGLQKHSSFGTFLSEYVN